MILCREFVSLRSQLISTLLFTGASERNAKQASGYAEKDDAKCGNVRVGEGTNQKSYLIVLVRL